MRHLSKGILIPVFFLGLIGSTAAEPAPLPEAEWDTTINHYQIDNDKFVGQRFSFVCPPVPNNASNDGVYGTDVYSSKSPICVAALHAGAIARDGGPVMLQLNPGGASYAGSVRNGVETASLPGTPRSIAFMNGAAKALNDKVHVDYLPRLKWDTKFTRTGFANMRLLGQQFSFQCPAAPGKLPPRRVVGTDTYEFGSVVCLSAVHAGTITTDGGVVTLRIDEGQRKLVGSIRNGIESHDGSSGTRTVTFVSPRT